VGALVQVGWRRRSTPCGDPTNTDLDLLFLRKLGPEGFSGGPAAYVFAYAGGRSEPYRGTAPFSWQSNGERPLIDRTGVGVYNGDAEGSAQLWRGHGHDVHDRQGSVPAGEHRDERTRPRHGSLLQAHGDLVNSAFTLAWTK
jgi:hypothetical protein